MENTVQKIRRLLDQEQIRYLSIVHSKAYSDEEITASDYNLGNELVDSVLIRINNQETVMVVVPSTRKISLESLQKELNNTNISFIGKREMKLLFPNYEAGTLPPLGCLYNMPMYCTTELKKMQEVTFYSGTRAYRIRMKMKDFFHVAKPQLYINADTTPRYRSEIYNVVPANKKQTLNNYDSCILGLSLENKNFVTAKLVGMIEWASRNFKSCIVLIGDSIHRHTLAIRGVEESYAYDKALWLGREAIDINNPVFQSYAECCNINVILCSQVQTSAEYHKHYTALETLFNNNHDFARCLRSFADTFVERCADPDSEQNKKNIHRSCTYLLEELAVFTCLSEQGHKVFLYPGALRALTEIAMNLHPDAPQALKDLISIELKIKRCGSS
jgi:tRNA-dependent cyclodipeptide synthase